MYKGLRISVAVATYNGEKFIKEQILSIIDQTVKVDEIIISDDQSSDNTLGIINEIKKVNNDINIIVLSNTISHGPNGNFENALKRCTGDVVFLSDQDDVWCREKVEQVVNVFAGCPGVHLVCHNAALIDKNGESIDGVFNDFIVKNTMDAQPGQYVRITKGQCIEQSVSGPLINGMAMCISGWLKDKAVPFPKTFASHDQWLAFLALKYDSFYCLKDVLAFYRLHGNNTAGNKAYTGNLLDKVRKFNKHLAGFQHKSTHSSDLYCLSEAIIKELDENDIFEKKALITAHRVNDISKSLIEVESSGRVKGTLLLVNLYKNDIRYRRSGNKAFYFELLYVLVNSKKTRMKNLGMRLG